MSIRVNVDQSFNVNVGNIGNVVNVVGDRRFNEKIKFEIPNSLEQNILVSETIGQESQKIQSVYFFLTFQIKTILVINIFIFYGLKLTFKCYMPLHARTILYIFSTLREGFQTDL
jgi:hypothetical protein